MRKNIAWLTLIVTSISMSPLAMALTADVIPGQISDIGSSEFLTEFGMLTGDIKFKLGDFSWTPSEVWLIPSQIEPNIFSKGLTQQEVIELPANLTFSKCRTAVYLNSSVGQGFKIYNTGTTTQIFENGTFCGLAYGGTYFVYARY